MSGRRPSPLVLGLSVLAAGAILAAVSVVGGEAAVTRTERTVTAKQGVVESVVSGSGNLAPSKQLDVDFATSGTVTHVYVKPGKHVTTGDLLARVDRTSADVQLAQAQAQLADAQDALDAAEAAATATPTPTPTPSPAATSRAPVAATATPAASGGGAAASGTSVTSAQASVASAQLSVREAENAVEATDLRAPMTGTVAAVTGAVGDQVSGSSGSTAASSGGTTASSTAFITLANLRRLTMDVSLSESDIADVKVGQAATVTVNAVDGEQLAAHVTAIGVLSSSSSQTGTGTGAGTSSAVSYPVTVALDQGAAGVRAGMSATADIVTARASGVVVPSQAVQGANVTIDENGRRSTRRVQTGVVGDSSTLILSGLSAGDTVVVTSTSAAAGRSATGGQAGAAGAAGARTRLGGGVGGPGGGFPGGGFAGGGPRGGGP